MYILGITGFTHDSAACLLKDGKLEAFVEEERLDRVKHSPHFPLKAIRQCLEMAGISFVDVDHITFFSVPWKEITANVWHFLRYVPRTFHLLDKKSAGTNEWSFLERIKLKMGVGGVLQKEFGLACRPKVHFIEHHLAHAASCFYPSPFEEAAILTMDGRGEHVTTLLGVGRGNRIYKLKEIGVPHSLGHFYSAITDYLGFRAFFDEWKVMGLSAYGRETYLESFRKLIHFGSGGDFQLDLRYFNFHTHGQKRWLSELFYRTFGEPRSKDGAIEQRHCDISFALQRIIEEAGVHLANELFRRTQVENLCLAGGVALNCLMNAKIMEQSLFKNVFIQPIANDAGTSWGSALYFHHERLNVMERRSFESIYQGPEFSNDFIEELLESRKLPYTKVDNIARQGAGLIAEGKVVGWFQGKMEAGPRALGNRSILANPCDPQMKDRLNLRVKKREFFRPFAPSVMEEHLHEYFEMPKNLASPHMILTGKVRESKRGIIPAVTHQDHTARVQSVGRPDNPRFHQLLQEFKALTGVPVLLNTSFNENEPIVCSPVEAIDCFQRTSMDALALGDYLLTK